MQPRQPPAIIVASLNTARDKTVAARLRQGSGQTIVAKLNSARICCNCSNCTFSTATRSGVWSGTAVFGAGVAASFSSDTSVFFCLLLSVLPFVRVASQSSKDIEPLG